jgi:hypothetical protein
VNESRSFRLLLAAILTATLSMPSYAQDAPETEPEAAKATKPTAPEAATAAPEAAPTESAPVDNTPPDPRSNFTVFKVFERSQERGGRFIQLGSLEDGEVLPVQELPKILELDRDPEIMLRLKKYKKWKAISQGATILTIGSGAASLFLWRQSVTSFKSSSSTALILFLVAMGGVGLNTLSDQYADQALFEAQSLHNNRIMERKPPKTSSLEAISIELEAFHF